MKSQALFVSKSLKRKQSERLLVVCSLCLGNFIVGLGLDSVNEVDELDGLLNEEHSYTVSKGSGM
jgi:hypothetical protein